LRFINRWLFALAASAYLLTLGLRTANHRKFLYSIPAHFGYHPIPPKIPQIALAEVVLDNTIVTLHDPVPGGGEVNLLELVCIDALIRRFQPARLLEIGTLGGRTTLNMVANTLPTAEIYTLDLPNTEHLRTDSPQELLGRRWIQLYGDSLAYDFSPLYGTLEFVFVDANHSYKHVWSDSQHALKMLRNGQGVIVWHDYTSWDWEGNTCALNDLYTQESAFRGLRHIAETTLVYLIQSPTDRRA